ncbi:MAG: hypothetical protein J6U41_03900, partial [Lachnospiraceae bacterium]|nr:hypothetical protein [Lachnospiraceae bacterium]
MKIRKLLLSLAAFAAAVFVYSNTAIAAPVQMADGNLFDPEFYAASYPDVVSIFGTDPNYLYLHYVVCGQAEGRLPYASSGAVAAPAAPVGPAQLQLDVFSALVGHGRVFENGHIIAQSPGYMQIET